jgi:hypothetical protein
MINTKMLKVDFGMNKAKSGDFKGNANGSLPESYISTAGELFYL